ncbi:MAG: hypothetical protein F4210_11165 [Holophagales bacterium]|nr:hypothetical protein [Holophagales bacterium]MYF96044.1 hypothetical protein [Holophagales bacterium]
MVDEQVLEHTPFEPKPIADGVIAGPLRHPRNLEQSIPGSIHEDSTARKLGLRGGTVAGSLHMEQFPPLLVEALGEEWWRTGGLSLYFKYATTDGEGVRCYGRRPLNGQAGEQVPVWMDMEDGRPVAEGTAWTGSTAEETPLEQRIESMPQPTDLRIFESLGTGRELDGIDARVGQEDLDQRLSVIVEPFDHYRSADRYGEAVLPPSLIVRLLTRYQRVLLADWPNLGVGLYGAIEIEHLAGPCFVEHDYEVRGRVVAVGETPKTEYFWYESTVSEPSGGEDRARMLMMIRTMKAASPLWQ